MRWRALSLLLLCGGSIGCARTPGAPAAHSPQVSTAEPQWVPSHSVPGGFYMGLKGDDTVPGPYVYRIKAPAGARVPAHWHNQTMRQRVLTGALRTVMGAPLDSGCVRVVLAGDTLTTPAYMPHIEWFDAETIIEVTTRGPLETEWARP